MRNTLKVFAFCLLLILFNLSYSNVNSIVSEVTISDLKCEYLNNPLGVDVEKPRFLWKILSNQQNTIQSAYHILVSESINELKKGNNVTGAILWQVSYLLVTFGQTTYYGN